MEASPVHESKSNGAIENAVQLVQGQFRSMKDCLESRLGSKQSCDSHLIPWLVLHACRTINRYHVGQDGLTAYQRWKGKPFKRDVAEFAERVMYLKAGSKGRDKFNCRWEAGIWLGIRDETGEVIIGTPEGVVKARDFSNVLAPRQIVGTLSQSLNPSAHLGNQCQGGQRTQFRSAFVCPRRGSP